MPIMEVLKITSPSTTGLQTYTFTKFGGQTPKALIVIHTAKTTEGVTADSEGGVGFATSSLARAVGFANLDNQATTSNTKKWGSGVIAYVSQLIASVDAFLPDQVRLNWTTTLINGAVCWLVALGGLDLSNAELVLFSHPTATGTFDITNSGSFQPDVALFLSCQITALDTVTNDTKLCLGATTGATKRWAIASTGHAAQNMTAAVDANKISSNGRCLMGLTTSSPVLEFADDFSLWLTNGVRLNCITAPATAYLCACLMLKGSSTGMFDVNSFNGPASAGDQDITTPGWVPDGVFFGTSNVTTLDTVEADWNTSTGAAHNGASISQGVVSAIEVDAILNTEADADADGTLSIVQLAPGNPSTISASAKVTSFLSNGFRVNWVLAMTKKVNYFAVKRLYLPELILQPYIAA